jgi:hypothetical protein
MSAPPLSVRAAVVCLFLALGCARPEAPERGVRATAAMLSETRPAPFIAPGAVLRADRHLLVTLRLAGSALTVLDAREVDMPLPLDRAPGIEPWRVLVENASGAPLYLAQLPAPAGVRAEVARPDGTLERVQAPAREEVLAIRLPLLREASALSLHADPSSLRPEEATRPAGMVGMGKTALPPVGP